MTESSTPRTDETERLNAQSPNLFVDGWAHSRLLERELAEWRKFGEDITGMEGMKPDDLMAVVGDNVQEWRAEVERLRRDISEDNAFHDALQELAVAQGKDPEQWDPIGVVDDALAQQDYAAAIAQALDLVLPMARGYAAEHPVGNNATMIEQAEAALDSTPRGAVAASAAEAYAVALQSALQPFADEGTKMRELYERDAMADSVLHMHITYGDLYRAADVLAKNPNPAGHPAAEPSAHESGALAGEGLGPVGLGPTEARHEIGTCSEGSDGEEVRSLPVGGAQDTQAGGDSGGMPLSVGRSRPDQTAISRTINVTGNLATAEHMDLSNARGLFFAPDDADYLRNLAAGRRAAGYNGSADKLDAIAAAIEAARCALHEE